MERDHETDPHTPHRPAAGAAGRVARQAKLAGCRDIEPSPFPGEQGRVFYFCGYDGGAGPSHNTVWVYKGTIKEKP